MNIYKKSEKRTAEPKTIPSTLNVVSYYDFKTNWLDDEFTSCEIIRRAGVTTKFDELIALTGEIMLKKHFKKVANHCTYFTLASRDADGKLLQLALLARDSRGFATGAINYSSYKYILLVAKDSFEIFVYEDPNGDIAMLAFWGFSSLRKKFRDKNVEQQMLTLINNAAPIV